ncbi:nitroreductase family protein [Paraferrimonas sp. SM1919]|uniref:nitroreductase family protein n=1 Tax=Paraferrimonas sp. SM1919 TaxID=2662263 RepID=UPI0013D1979E|nr:nitroreductase family protein [Paraferrimonas sp. SM1919]
MASYTALETLIHQRRSVRKYDQQHQFNHDSVQRALELATLSPNSSNMQLWQFHRVIDADKKAALAKICMNQNAAKTANELVVFVTTPTDWKQRAENNAKHIRDSFNGRTDKAALGAYKYYEKLIPFLYNNDRFGLYGMGRKVMSFVMGFKRPMVREVAKSDVHATLHKSSSLAAMTFMLAMTEQGYDTCPMEGFDSNKAKKLLGLPSNVDITMIISCGKRTDEGVYGERQRVENDSVIFKH